MSELIKREDLENWLRTECYGTDTDDDKEYVIERLRNELPTASPWHRVEEKPDEHTNLWLHDERGNYHVGCVSTYRGYTEYIDMGGNTLHDIDYWMPIEPPKEEVR